MSRKSGVIDILIRDAKGPDRGWFKDLLHLTAHVSLCVLQGNYFSKIILSGI